MGKEEIQAESRNTWISALAEAAFMTGLERNAEVVQMCSYAPLFAHVDAWQWRPDLIWFDNLRSAGTANYYVQKLFSNNRGSHVVPVLRDGQTMAGKDSLYASAAIDRQSKAVIVKIVNATDSAVPLEINFDGVRSLGMEALVTELYSNDLFACNSLDHPVTILPVTSSSATKNKKIISGIKPRSLTVIKVSCEF
jgi:alpha-L-arabinofuranosidase